jgi:acyl carrier protein
MSDNRATIRAFIADEFLPDVPAEELGYDDNLDAGIIDSLGVLQVIAWLEDTFDVVLDDAEIGPDSFGSVSAIDRFVAQVRLEADARRS